MEKNLEKFKIAAAVALLVSFFLPMSSCSYTVPLDLGIHETSPESERVTGEKRTVIMYAREYTDYKEPGSWLNLLSFTWPFFVIVLQLRFRGKRFLILLPSAGVLLSLLSAAVIFVWADVGKPLVGAYVGWCGAVGLFVSYLTELIRGVRGEKS